MFLWGAGCSSTALPTPDRFELVQLDTDQVGAITTAIDPHTLTIYWSWAARRDSLTDIYLRGWLLQIQRRRPLCAFTPNGAWAICTPKPPQVRVGLDGTVYVLWSNRIPVPGRRFPASNLYLVRSTDSGQTFSPPCLVNDDADGPPSSHTLHDLAIGPDGTVYVSWIDARRLDAQPWALTEHAHPASPTGPDLRVARSTNGGTALTPVLS